MLTLAAAAKVNLTLEVLQKRPDGYHEIRSVLQAISLCDTLSFQEAEKVSFQCGDPVWEAEKSLVSRVVNILREQTGCSRGALIKITKHVPISSGLGGDSSDAAGVFLGLNKMWQLGIAPGELVRMAGMLGSDVPFFLYGGTALARGRGELISPLPDMPRAWIVLLMPQVGRPGFKTGAMYASLSSAHYTHGVTTDALVKRITYGQPLGSCDLCNIFEAVAFEIFTGLDKYREEFQRVAAEAVHLAGAGPTMYALFNDEKKAAVVWRHLKEQGLEAYLAHTLDSAKL